MLINAKPTCSNLPWVSNKFLARVRHFLDWWGNVTQQMNLSMSQMKLSLVQKLLITLLWVTLERYLNCSFVCVQMMFCFNPKLTVPPRWGGVVGSSYHCHLRVWGSLILVSACVSSRCIWYRECVIQNRRTMWNEPMWVWNCHVVVHVWSCPLDICKWLSFQLLCGHLLNRCQKCSSEEFWICLCSMGSDLLVFATACKC